MVAQSKLNHALKLMSSLEDMKSRKIVCDFEVRVQGKCFSVHRSVLVACSKYFEGMLTSDMKEARQGFVDMMNLSAEGVERCIDFMYTGELEITSNSVRPIIEASHLIELHGLTEICLQHLRDNLNGETCLHALDVFKIYGKEYDVTTAERRVIKSLDVISRSEMFRLISKQDLIRYLRNPTIDPEVHWKATISWIERNEYKEDDFLVEALNTLMSTREVSLSFLLIIIWKHKNVQSSMRAKSVLLESLSARAKSLETDLNMETSFNLLEVMRVNEFENKDLLKKSVTKHLAENFEEATKDERLIGIGFKELLDILRSKNFRVQEESTKWEAVVTWVKKCRTRGKHLADLMKDIKFENLSAEYIHQNIKGNPLVKKSAECLEILYDVMFARQTQSVGVDSSALNVESTSLVMMDSERGSLVELDLNGGRHNEIVKFSKSRCQIVLISGNPYLIHSHDRAREVYEFNELENWKLRSTKQLQWWMRIVQFRNKMYFVGQYVMACYDPIESRWEKDLPGCGNDFAFCLAGTGDFIYALGGFSSNRAVRFDPGSLKWTEICSMKHERWNAAATSYRGNIWVAGGCDSTVECYDPSTNLWQTIASLDNIRRDFSLVVHNNKLYAVGGACDEDGDRLSKDSVVVYDEDSNKWRVVVEMNKSEDLISSCICDATLIQRHKSKLLDV